jgi:hypothetical protein
MAIYKIARELVKYLPRNLPKHPTHAYYSFEGKETCIENLGQKFEQRCNLP